MSILSLQTTTFSAYGGIPTYNRLTCRALNEGGFAGKHHVLVGMDRPADLEKPAAEMPNVRLRAFAENRLALTSCVVRLGLTRKFDLALIGHANYAPLGWMMKRLQPKLIYGVMLYGIEAWQQLPPVRRSALQQADFIVSISDYTKERAVEANNLDPKRIYVLPNALEWEDAAPVSAEDQSRAMAGSRLLSVCRLDQAEQYKGVDKVIEALPGVLQRIPDLQYTVVGGGSDLERLKDLTRKLGLGERVHFLGFVGDATLQACYRSCDLFVLPSGGEGFGFVFLEAMRYSKAVVAANSGGAPEVVQDGVTGSLVQYGDTDQLAETLIGLCLDQNRRQHLGQAGYQLLLKKFTFARFKQNLADILMKELPSGLPTSHIPRFDETSAQLPQ